MRIAMFVSKFPVLSETFVLNQVTGLIDRGHEVDIFVYKQRKFDPKHFHNDVEKYELLKHTYYFPQLTSKRWLNALIFCKQIVTLFLKDPVTISKFLNISCYGKGQGIMQKLCYASVFIGKEPYDIVHCQFGVDGINALRIKDMPVFKKAKLITSFRGFDISQVIKEKGENYYKELFQRGDFFLANCEYFKKRLIRLGCDQSRIEVLRSGLNYDGYTFTERAPGPNGEVKLVTVGRFVEKKGIEYGIRAVAQVAQKNKNISYSIIGYGPLEDDCKKLINELGANEYIHILGKKKENEIIEILEQSHLFLAPSVTAENGDQDGPVNTIKEAVCLGLPVIATDHGGIPELVQDGVSGFLVPERNDVAIADRINYYIDHPEIWTSMALAGRQTVEQDYDLNKLNDRLAEIYENLIKEGMQSAGKC